MKKFICLFDRHYGWEKKRVDGKLITSPTHDMKLFKSVMEFVKDFNPDLLIDGGDGFNMSPVSRFNRGKPRLTEGFSLQREYDFALRDQIIPMEEAAPNAERVFMLGNHEHWIELLLNENPELEGLLEPVSYLKLEERGWKVVGYGQMYKITSKLGAIHGDTLRTAAKYRANKILEAYNHNIISGHAHTCQVMTSTAMADQQNHISVICGMMGNPTPDYGMHAPSNSVQGFGYGYAWGNGYFNIYPIIASKGKFAAEGKLYG